MDASPEKKPSQKDRTIIEQNYVEALIKSFFERYYTQCLEHEKFEDDPNEEHEEDLEKAVSHFLLRHFHGSYVYNNLKSTGIYLLKI